MKPKNRKVRFSCHAVNWAARLRVGSVTICAVFLGVTSSAAIGATADTFSIKEMAGVTTTNYPVQIGRPFVVGEIENFPQVGICGDASCTIVSQWLITQADVKQHWTDGTVKHAVLSFYIPKLNASSTVYFKVQNQPGCNCGTGLTQAQMLASNYNFDATETYTNGVTASVSARTLLSAWDGATQGITGPVYYWTKGVNSTTLIIADNRNSQACNHHACSSNDFGSDTNKSLRPEFHVTFWPLTNQVKVRFVGEIVNTEAMQVQSYDLSLSVGSTSPTAVYTQTNITHGVAERWTVDTNDETGQTWSVSTAGGTATFRKEIWIGGVPSPIAINHNLAYLESTYFISNYDLTLQPTEAAIEAFWGGWNAPTGSYIYSTGGYWIPFMHTGGASSFIGPIPNWVLPWLYTGDIRMQELALRVSELECAYDGHIIEGHSGKNLNRSDAGGVGTGLGHVLSISSRPTLDGDFAQKQWQWNASNPTDNIVPVGTASSEAWDDDEEHEPDFGSIVYALTGDFFFLQEQMFSSSWEISTDNGVATTSSWGRGPTGAEGGKYDDDPRTQAWYVRTLATTAFTLPDVDFAAEKSYFTTALNDFIAIEEGARCGSGDIYSWCSSSPFHGNPNWVWGYTYRAQSNNQTSYGANQGTTYPVLHQWQAGLNNFVEAKLDGDTNGYGPQAIPGTGSITTSGTSATITFSSSGQCSAMHTNEMIYFANDGDRNIDRDARIVSLSCPTATLDAAWTLTAGGGSWNYAPVTQDAISQFSSDYLMYSLGRAAELGYSTGNLTSWLGQFFIGLVNDPGSNPRLLFNGRMPTIDVTTGTYFKTYSRLKQAFQTEWQNLNAGFAPAGESNSPPTGYPAYARAAYSMLINQPGGSTAWTFFINNVNNDIADFQRDPTWALVPRGSATSAPPPSGQSNACDLNSDGVTNVLDVQIAVAEATGALPCTMSSCGSSVVASLVSTALGGTCELH
jgi:hypothetical protein